MHNNHRTERGYSLAEVMVAVAVFTTIIIAALMLYDRSNRIFKRGVENSNLQQNTRVAFDSVTNELRRAGYDFDRDGIPTGNTGGTNAYQQPDEQFEYIGPSAITIRGNFDFETETTPCGGTVTDNCDNGRERTLESAQFPVVTTGNDEIVTYALVPDSQTSIPSTCDPTTNCVQFYADVGSASSPARNAYPGGANETLVQIKGVDLCPTGCNNPPYTLYRFTFTRNSNASNINNAANQIRTPLASNIRSLNFTYFEDANGDAPLMDVAGTTNISTGATVRGEGQYNVASPASLVAGRTIRTKVYSVRTVLVGMAEAGEANFVAPGETIASVRNRRQFRLETLINPRNAQKRGMREQDTVGPGKPTNVTICSGRCGIAYLSWTAPGVSATQGAPDQYKVIYDLAAAPGYAYESTTFTNTFGYVPGLTPNVAYKFKVVALNSYGSATSDASVTLTPLNATQPAAPTGLTASTTLNGRVTLTWNRPTTNNAGSVSCGPNEPAPGETRGYEVWRTTDLSGGSGWTRIADMATVNSFANNVTWDDTTAANCTDYLYRVRAMEECSTNDAYNTSGSLNSGISPFSTNAQGLASSGVPPRNPSDLRITDTGICNAGICSANVEWPPVTQDTDGNTISINKYTVSRRLVGGAPTWTAVATDVPGTPVSGWMRWTDTNVSVGGGEQYQYKVTAKQCGLTSADSPIRTWPCDIPVGTIGAPAIIPGGDVFDGAGTAADPWAVPADATFTVNILNAANVASVVARIYVGGTQVTTLTDNSAPYNFGFATTDFVTYRADINVNSTGGCTRFYTVYFTGSPQSCCLVPRSADPTLGTHSAGTTLTTLKLRNICGPLTLYGFTIAWNTNINNRNPAEKLSQVVFPATGGAANSCPAGITSPTGRCTIFNVGGGGNSPVSTTTLQTSLTNGPPAPVAAGATSPVWLIWTRTFNTFQVTEATFSYIEQSDLAQESCAVVVP